MHPIQGFLQNLIFLCVHHFLFLFLHTFRGLAGVHEPKKFFFKLSFAYSIVCQITHSFWYKTGGQVAKAIILMKILLYVIQVV